MCMERFLRMRMDTRDSGDAEDEGGGEDLVGVGMHEYARGTRDGV
jgi:hypothetical protein